MSLSCFTGCLGCFPGYPRPDRTKILNAEGGIVERGTHHALILLRVKSPNEADSRTVNVVYDLCWKLRVHEWSEQDLAEQSQRLLSIDGEGARLPRAVGSSGSLEPAHEPAWRLKPNLKVGQFFKAAVDLESYRNQHPWNPKYNNCHDFIMEQVPQLVDADGAELASFLENGVLCSRKHTEALFRNRGSCLAKVVEWYVRYIGGLSGSSRKQQQQDLDDEAAMVYAGYNRHPLQQAQPEHQICSVDSEIVEAALLFRRKPMGHCNVAPFGVTEKSVVEDYDFKANYLKEFKQSH